MERPTAPLYRPIPPSPQSGLHGGSASQTVSDDIFQTVANNRTQEQVSCVESRIPFALDSFHLICCLLPTVFAASFDLDIKVV